MSNPRIHWIRIFLGGLLAEVALILAIVPLGLRLGDNFLHYTAPPGSFIMRFLAALWVGRRIESRFVLQGTLVGAVAVLIYVALTQPIHEVIFGCIASGWQRLGVPGKGFTTQYLTPIYTSP